MPMATSPGTGMNRAPQWGTLLVVTCGGKGCDEAFLTLDPKLGEQAAWTCRAGHRNAWTGVPERTLAPPRRF